MIKNREFPYCDEYGHRKAVCKRCHVIMSDAEPMSRYGEYYHPNLNKKGKPHSCKNAGKMLTSLDSEIEPFLPKSRRRFYKRMGYKA